MKFSIRDLLLVTVIVALAVGWGVDSWRTNTRLNKEREWRSSLIYLEGPVEAFYGGVRKRIDGNVWVEPLPNYPTPLPNAPSK